MYSAVYQTVPSKMVPLLYILGTNYKPKARFIAVQTGLKWTGYRSFVVLSHLEAVQTALKLSTQIQGRLEATK